MSVCAFSGDSKQCVRRHTECGTGCTQQPEDSLYILISGQTKHVWSALETKQYPLLDDTEIACGAA